MNAVVHHTPNIPLTELPPLVSIVTTGNGRTTFMTSRSGRRSVHIFEPRCNVCTVDPEVLDEIHRLASNGSPVARIGKIIRQDAKLTNRQIQHHLVTHVPDYASYERAISSAAQAFGEGEFPARVSGLHASQIIIERGTKLLAEGRVELKASDIMAAARFQYEMESDGKTVADGSSYATIMTIMLTKFQQALGPARFNAVMWSLGADPGIIEIMQETGLSPAAALENKYNPVRELLHGF